MVRDVKFHTQKHLQQKHVINCEVKNDPYTTIYLVDKILTEHKEKLPQDIINIKCKNNDITQNTRRKNIFCDLSYVITHVICN